jgi:hypothetical protein
MRAIPFRDVLDGVTTKLLGNPDRARTEDAAAYTRYINEHVRECWERANWPEWCPVEERHFRDTWSAQAYAEGDEVWHAATAAYYQANDATLAGDVPGTSGKWDDLTEFQRYVSLDQTGETPIGTVLAAYERDPRLYPGASPVDYTLTAEGVLMLRTSATSVWLHFRKRPPVFSSEEWDEDTAYVAGDLAYYQGETYERTAEEANYAVTVSGAGTAAVNGTYTETGTYNDAPIFVHSSGNYCIYRDSVETPWELHNYASGSPGATSYYYYAGAEVDFPWEAETWAEDSSGTAPVPTFTNATADTEPGESDLWTLVPFPYVLARAVRLFAYAEALEEDGQHEKAQRKFADAEDALCQEWTKAEAQQGIVRRFRVLNRPHPRGGAHPACVTAT